MAGSSKSSTNTGNDKPVVTKNAVSEEVLLGEANRRKILAAANQLEKELRAHTKEELQVLAVERTREAQAKIREVEIILGTGIANAGPLNWDSAFVRKQFSQPEPEAPPYEKAWQEPKRDEEIFKPDLKLIDYLLPPLRHKKEAEEESRYKHLLTSGS